MAIEIAEPPVRLGNKQKLKFFMDSDADLPELRTQYPPGGKAAYTSSALDLTTYDMYYLMHGGWRKGGEPV